MAKPPNRQSLQMESSRGSLLQELKIIWDEVGESEAERDKMLLEIEQECLEVYRRKVYQANMSRAQLRQAIADAEAEIAAICSAMGEPPVHVRQCNQNAGSLKEELKAIIPELEEMKKRKNDRKNQILEVVEQIKEILIEIRPPGYDLSTVAVDESALSVRMLEELHGQLQLLQEEKADRLRKVQEHLSTLSSLCLVLSIDFKQMVGEVDPNLNETGGFKNTSDDTIERLTCAIHRLREIKRQRMEKLQDLASTMLELWNLMDTPTEEQQSFQSVTCNIAASEHEIIEPDALSVDFIKHVEAEVLRLEEQKNSKMKELVLRKKSELEEIRRRAHLVAEGGSETEFAYEAVENGDVDSSLVLGQMEFLISEAKEQAFSRKDILERVEKWLAACEEESWLEEYNRDENRYSAGRGTHLALKRAEKARILVSKIPAMVEALSAKTTAWEKEKGNEFKYDGVSLLSMLEDYTTTRQEKEQERKRQRDQRRLQGQLTAAQEALFGSKPSPLKNVNKVTRTFSSGPSRRPSTPGATSQSDSPRSAKSSHAYRKSDDGSGLSAVRRDLDATFMSRKPFAPLVSDSNMPSTPTKCNCDNAEEEIGTHKSCMKIEATAPVSLTSQAVVIDMPREMEYSFEERRAGFVVKSSS
ncbi:65-kDa microtubule-associated protein 3 [Elaeis guineensis]|uniref:65-kDa microtubule-associated protein 3 n=1 Tax=Elaeis guineensis var. tenera TaxID=51953 RepID=A0A8N4IB96_ELAGV|nr:65-kDa microtubule-associated protein 3 [Elaeis guineensis]